MRERGRLTGRPLREESRRKKTADEGDVRRKLAGVGWMPPDPEREALDAMVREMALRLDREITGDTTGAGDA
jgi:hypothetical protein